jgi:hypothetical protein
MARLRGHHLLCLLGYRGMGYSAEYVANMTRLHQLLRSEPNTPVTLVSGPDDLCAEFPSDQPYHCLDDDIGLRDAAVLDKLGLTVDTVLSWQEIQTREAERVVPQDVLRLCSTCSWLTYGVCQEGVARIRDGRGLFPVEIL